MEVGYDMQQYVRQAVISGVSGHSRPGRSYVWKSSVDLFAQDTVAQI